MPDVVLILKLYWHVHFDLVLGAESLLVNDVGGRVEADLATKDREFVEKENRALRKAINGTLQSVQRSKLKRAYDKEMKNETYL